MFSFHSLVISRIPSSLWCFRLHQHQVHDYDFDYYYSFFFFFTFLPLTKEPDEYGILCANNGRTPVYLLTQCSAVPIFFYLPFVRFVESSTEQCCELRSSSRLLLLHVYLCMHLANSIIPSNLWYNVEGSSSSSAATRETEME